MESKGLREMDENKFSVRIEDNEEFYPIFRGWCEKREFPCIPIRQIDTTFVCYKEEKPLYSIFFWRTNSTFCVVGFPFSDKDIPYKEKKGGLEFLIKEVSRVAKKSGYEIIWTTSDTPRVIESMLENGFNVADTKVDQYYKRLF